MDPEREFPMIDGRVYVRVDGYFSSGTKKKIPFQGTDKYMYYVEHLEGSSKKVGTRSYYRTISAKSGPEFVAIFTSKNEVKKKNQR